MYELLSEIRRCTRLLVLSVIDSGGWIWIQLALPPRFTSATLRYNKSAPLKPGSLLLSLNGAHIKVHGTSREEQASHIGALLDDHREKSGDIPSD
jgi:hypothetical protein